MSLLKDYFDKHAELNQQVKANLPWIIRRACPNLKLEAGCISFDDSGDLLTDQELYEFVRELMKLTGVTDSKSNKRRVK